MTACTILTLANGRGVDLDNPSADDVDFDAYAEHLAKEKRFNGATPNEEYSVAQHLCLGTTAILKATGDIDLARYFSLHDGHEAVWKDDPTPKKRTIAARVAARCGVLAADILAVLDEIVFDHDVAIHLAAGLAWPMPDSTAVQVKHWDLTMFVTEWRDLMPGVVHPDWTPYSHLVALPERIEPWPWQVAKRGLIQRWRQLLPALAPDKPEVRT